MINKLSFQWIFLCNDIKHIILVYWYNLLLVILCWIWLSMSSSSCCAISTDLPDPLSPPLPIVHCFQRIFRATPHIGTELLQVGSSWSSCFCSSLWRDPQEYVTYEFIPTSPAVSCLSGLSNLDIFCDGW